MSEELREMLREQCILCGKAEWEEIHALCKNCQGKIQRDRGIAKAVKDKAQRNFATRPPFAGLGFLEGFMSKPDGKTMPGFVLYDVEHAMFDCYALKSRLDSLTMDLTHLLDFLGGKDSATYREWKKEADELKSIVHDVHMRLIVLLPEWKRPGFERMVKP